MFGDIRRFVELTSVDCSQLVSKIDNYTTLAKPEEVEKEPNYFTDAHICLNNLL